MFLSPLGHRRLSTPSGDGCSTARLGHLLCALSLGLAAAGCADHDRVQLPLTVFAKDSTWQGVVSGCALHLRFGAQRYDADRADVLSVGRESILLNSSVQSKAENFVSLSVTRATCRALNNTYRLSVDGCLMVGEGGIEGNHKCVKSLIGCAQTVDRDRLGKFMRRLDLVSSPGDSVRAGAHPYSCRHTGSVTAAVRDDGLDEPWR